MVNIDCEKYYNNIADDIEKAANTGNLRDVYRSINELSGKKTRSTATLKDENGYDLTTIHQQLNR